LISSGFPATQPYANNLPPPSRPRAAIIHRTCLATGLVLSAVDSTHHGVGFALRYRGDAGCCVVNSPADDDEYEMVTNLRTAKALGVKTP